MGDYRLVYNFHWDSDADSLQMSENEIKTNLVYPWLDNKTFNKWFIPDGVSVPLSAFTDRRKQINMTFASKSIY